MTLSGSAGALSFGYKMPEADQEGLAEGFVESCRGLWSFMGDFIGFCAVFERFVRGLQSCTAFRGPGAPERENMGHLISRSL